jgi:hypothetical protein
MNKRRVKNLKRDGAIKSDGRASKKLDRGVTESPLGWMESWLPVSD